MIYSKTAEYAIRALSYFAQDSRAKESVSITRVSAVCGVPAPYAAKIFRCLSKSGVLSVIRGKKGGFALKIPAEKLTLFQVIQCLDNPEQSPFKNCVMGFEKCDDKTPCPLHPVWTKAKERMRKILQTTSIADIASLRGRFSKGARPGGRLSREMRSLFSV